MNTLTKGALKMALAGSVTFAVTNALLADQFSKPLTLGNAAIRQSEKMVKDQVPIINVKEDQTRLPHDISVIQLASEDTNKNDRTIPVIQQDIKKVSKTPVLNTASTEKTTPVVKVVSVTNAKAPGKKAASTPIRTNTTNTAKPADVKTVPKNSTKAPVTTAAPKPAGTGTTNTAKPADKTTVPGNSTEAPSKQTPSTPAGNKVTSTDKTTKANHGQQVSQAAKEKAASNRDKKENNGKEM
ncbi:hypothetical protein [Metabacillus fastidiosus]|uniref:hypothetical protein n=1 Tax=Metabacillus fastidiosus TaxID=1458 RepID=UPI002E2324A1|nr:hypothetical protein [Metabacillus fastidiosus]